MENGCIKSSFELFITIVLLSIIPCARTVTITDLPLTTVFLQSLIGQKYSPSVSSTIKREYDYIVVGAGSAGSVVASRLSELPCVNVLLLEAGDAPPVLSEVPPLAFLMWFTRHDWQYQTVPQKNAGIGLRNRQFPLPLGKMLGGSSSINNMLYVRGNKKNFDDWAAGGAEGWSYKDVFPYFLKLEDNRDIEFLENGYHNTSGPVTFEQPDYSPPVKTYIKRAFDELGFEFVDSNAERQTGVYDLQGNSRNGQRCSTVKAYLVPAKERENLDIITKAMVKKVVIENGRAVGVEFDLRGRTYQVQARREVILSAGAINTPQILMLSGIGPKEELDKLGIPVIADLPVGKNLCDQAAVLQLYEFGPRVRPLYTKLLNPVNIVRYITERSGPYSSISFLLYLAFLRGNSSSIPPDYPNYELYMGEITTAEISARFYGLSPEVYDAWLKPYNFKPLLLCLVTHTVAKSKGTVSLNSTDIYDPPLIDPNYFDDPQDIEDLVDGMKVCERLGTSRALQRVGTKPLATLIPGCEEYADDEDSYFRCKLRHVPISSHHMAGTAKMGSVDDPTTVVDPQLRVKTIDNLRVVDASVMPTTTSGNINIPIIMIGEKASDMIKEDVICDEGTRSMTEDEEDELPVILDDENESEDVSPLQESADIIHANLNEILNSPDLQDRVDYFMERLLNPMQYLDLGGQSALLNTLRDLRFASIYSIVGGIQDLLTIV